MFMVNQAWKTVQPLWAELCFVQWLLFCQYQFPHPSSPKWFIEACTEVLLLVKKRKPATPSKMIGTWLLPLGESSKYQQSRKLSRRHWATGRSRYDLALGACRCFCPTFSVLLYAPAPLWGQPTAARAGQGVLWHLLDCSSWVRNSLCRHSCVHVGSSRHWHPIDLQTNPVPQCLTAGDPP